MTRSSTSLRYLRKAESARALPRCRVRRWPRRERQSGCRRWPRLAGRRAQQAEAIVYSLIVVPVEASAGRDTGGEHALIQLSEDTGGKYYYASSLAQLDSAFKQISDELRAQYLLAYYPSQRVSNSEFRRIQVTVSGPPASAGDRVRHRTGYYSAKPDF